MVVITDQKTFSIVFIGILAILAIFGVAFLVLNAMDKGANRKGDGILENLREALDKSKAGIIAIIEKDRTTFQQTSVEEFMEMIRAFLKDCISYGESRGLDLYAAIEDTVLYSREILRAYAQACSSPELVEEQTDLVSTIIRESLRLEALESEKMSMLKGGLSNPG